MSNEPVRRKVTVVSDVTVVPSIDRLTTDALGILSCELAYYRTKTASGAVLNEKEVVILQRHIDSLVKLSKEAREIAKAEDLSKLSNEELLELAESIVAKAK